MEGNTKLFSDRMKTYLQFPNVFLVWRRNKKENENPSCPFVILAWGKQNYKTICLVSYQEDRT